MSSKLTGITESSPSEHPPSVLCGSGVFSRFSSPSMASSGHFDPSQTYDGYKAAEGCGRWINAGGPIPIGGRPRYSSSEVPISRINTEGVVKRIRRISDSPTDPDAEGSDELYGEEVPLDSRFQSQAIPSTPRTSQPVVASIPTSLPPASPSPSHDRPALNQAVRHYPTRNPGTHP
ncbi:hypothetical protein O181_074288 [Austropuccinia psidii MF-1]|uniref:Uncharacterized protein n=1 Tax=Austropuccinia psidii MF-1 TaxID=1389203 RepID=A0A9Q3F6M8_9BASI|nr:hypothetical protein [Austropuccinia psidii MF-1]